MAESIQTKQCTKCKQIKLISEFYKDKTRKDGYCSRCKQCRTRSSQLYYIEHRAKCLQSIKCYYQKHQEKRQQYQKQRRKNLYDHLRDVWHHMRHRCNNPKIKAYKNYGGRGIQVKFDCFEDFYNYVKELKVEPRGLTIDRIDNDGHYERGNIQFITRAENTRKRFRKT